ncbi:MAG TPA: hypothetical protein VK936_11850, partial [Longimicrobiales bacterium]|nr:hypothetical protein [Longimicrobiales bacterium]
FTGTDNLGIAGTSGPVTTTAGAATQYLVTTTPDSAVVAGGPVTITAQLADANGNAVAQAGRTVTWSKTGDGGSFASPTTATNASGIATVTFTTGTTADTVYTFTGTDNEGATGTSGPVTTTAGAATQYLVTTNTATVVAGGPVTITAQLADANGNAVALAGRTVTWSKTGDGGSFASPNTSTNASGIATVTFTTGTTAGTVYTFTGTDNLGATGTSGPVTTTAGAATQYLVTVNDTAPIAGTEVVVTAQLADLYGNAVAEADRMVNWSSTNGGSFVPNPSFTNALGVATTAFTTGEAPDTAHVVTAEDDEDVDIRGESPEIVTQEPPDDG